MKGQKLSQDDQKGQQEPKNYPVNTFFEAKKD